MVEPQPIRPRPSADFVTISPVTVGQRIAIGVAMSIQNDGATAAALIRLGRDVVGQLGWAPGRRIALAYAPGQDLRIRLMAANDGALTARRAHGKKGTPSLFVRIGWIAPGLARAGMRDVDYVVTHGGQDKSVTLSIPADWRDTMRANLDRLAERQAAL